MTAKLAGSLLLIVLLTGGAGTHIFYQLTRFFHEEGAHTALAFIRWEIIILLVVAILIAGATILFFHRAIAQPVAEMVEAARRLSEGDFTVDLKASSQAEIESMAQGFRQMVKNLRGLSKIAVKIADGDLTKHVRPYSDTDELGNAYKLMIDNLRRIVTRVRSSSERVNAGSEQIAVASRRITEEAREQVQALEESSQSIEGISNSLQETARHAELQSGVVGKVIAAMAEVTSSVRQVAENAERVSGLADESAREARTGGEAVGKVVASMDRIQASMDSLTRVTERLGEKSREINAIVAAISDIAEQTNLLALNAAIEAARAGQQGKGFAVVAEEVGKLAGRASQSTKEIGDLIRTVQDEMQRAAVTTGESTRLVGDGTRLANQAGEAIAKIIDTAAQTAAAISEISEVGRHQTDLVEGTVKAMDQLGRITQEIAASVEEQSAGAQQIAASANKVRELTRSNLKDSDSMSESAMHLTSLAKDLDELVHGFKLPESEALTTPAAAF